MELYPKLVELWVYLKHVAMKFHLTTIITILILIKCYRVAHGAIGVPETHGAEGVPKKRGTEVFFDNNNYHPALAWSK